MGTMLLTGSKGYYNPKKTPPVLGKELNFVVTIDTCMEAETLPVRFLNAAEGCYIKMENAKITLALTKDY